MEDFWIDHLVGVEAFDGIFLPTLRRSMSAESSSLHLSVGSGIKYVEDLESQGPARTLNFLRMDSVTYLALVTWLLENTSLRDSRMTSAREKLLMFLWTVGHDSKNRDLQECFSRSAETVSQ
jgi:hypothetical protein